MTTPAKTSNERRVSLSEIRKWLWSLENRGVRGPEYHVQLCLQLEGKLDLARLESSLKAVVARHEVLRARVEVVDESPFQCANAEDTPGVPIVDLSQRAGAESEARKRMRVWAREPFDLRADVLIRYRLIQLGPERYWLHVVAHRFICDEESMGIIAGEVAARYGAVQEEGKLPSAIVSLQESIAETYAKNKDDGRALYWKDRVRTAPPIEGSRESDSAAERSLTSEVEAGLLSSFCRDHQTSMAQLTMAAFAILLQRYVGQTEISLSIQPVDLTKTRSIGPVSDALPLSLAIADTATAREILQLTRVESETALSNAPVPFEVIGETLTDALFVFTDQTPVDLTAGGVRFRSLEEQSCFSRFKLEWHVRQQEDLLKVQAIYRKDLCETDVIERMLENYLRVLQAIVAGIDQRIDDLLPPISLEQSLNSQKLSEGNSAEQPASDRELMERELAEVWAEILGVSEVGIHENFFARGGDSILSVLMVAKCRQRGVHITPRQIFQHKTIASLAAVAVRETPVSAPSFEFSEADGVNLTPIQQWFFEQPGRTPSRFNQAVVLEGRKGLKASAVVKAVRAVQSHHNSLRLRFSRDGGKWRQFVAEEDSMSDCVCLDLWHVPVESRADKVRLVADELQSAINVENGTLIRTAWLDFGPDAGGQLLVIIHHLAVDGISWRLLLEDLERAYTLAEQGETIALTPIVTPYPQWAAALHERAKSPAVQSEIDYWLKVMRSPSAVPYDFDNGLNTESSARKVSITFDPERTATLLQGRADASEVWIQQALLASLGQVLGEWTGRNEVRIDVEGHGRQDISMGVDVSRTIGWFTSIYPLSLPASLSQLSETLTKVREQLKQVHDQGINYGLLRFFSPEANWRERLRGRESAAVCFNYLGQFDHLWSGDEVFRPLEETMSLRNGEDLRAYILQLDASIISGQLRVDWEYSENLHRPETIQRLADSFKHHLWELAELVGAEADPLLQFALVALDQRQLDQVLAELEAE